MDKQEVIKELNDQKRCWNPEYILSWSQKKDWTESELFEACHDFENVLDTEYENDFTFECSYVEVAKCFIDDSKCKEACKKALTKEEPKPFTADWDQIKIIAVESFETPGEWSVQFATGFGFNVWMDNRVTESNDVDSDWNRYIFYDWDEEGQKIKQFQENDSNFDICSSMALDAGIKNGIIVSVDNGYKAAK